MEKEKKIQEDDSVILHLKNRTIILHSSGLDGNVDVDDLLYIDYSNLFAESITVSVLINKIGQLKAEANAIYEHKKLDFDIFEAKLAKNFRMQAKSNEEK